MIKKSLYAFAAVLLTTVFFSACRPQKDVSLNGKIDGMADSALLVIKRLDFNVETVMDTLTVENKGDFNYAFNTLNDQPSYYYLYLDGRRLCGLVLKAGDKVQVNTNSYGKPCHVEGSPETEVWQQAEDHFAQALKKFDSLTVLYNTAQEPRRTELSYALGGTFVKYKQEAIRFMFSHPHSFANTAVAFHAFPGAMYVFSDSKDAPLLRRVYDSLQPVYPSSAYVAAIRERSETMERALKMETALQNVEVTDFPDICVTDIDAKSVCLSSLKGSPIILSFWQSQNVNLRLDNKELIELYENYHSKGLEVYQVALDTDKTLWANAVRDQQLPWISVCDGLGVYSPSVSTYNVTEVPTYYVINREGTLMAKVNTFAQLEAEIRKLF